MQAEYPPDVSVEAMSLVQNLRENGAVTNDETDVHFAKEYLREYVGTLRLPANSGPKSRGRGKDVYYLYGQERSAARKLIEENEDYCRSCVSDSINPIARNLDEYWWKMIKEEWKWSEDTEVEPPKDTYPKTPAVEKLRDEGPLAVEEVPEPETEAPVDYIDFPGAGEAVAYLLGEERAGVREFISRNPGFVRTQIESRSNLLHEAEDFWTQMFYEEWKWGDY